MTKNTKILENVCNKVYKYYLLFSIITATMKVYQYALG